MKRFYHETGVAEGGTGFQVTLDGRAVKTQGGNPQILPNRAMAQAMAEEWAMQGQEMDPAGFILRDFADYAIDIVADNRAQTMTEILPYGETDTLCYRAMPDDDLFQHQQERWEPFLTAFEARHKLQLQRISGIIHRPQTAETMAKLHALLDGKDAFSLSALKTLASLAASLSIALAALEDDADYDGLWALANLEEDWQAELWGRDQLAEERRAHRLEAFKAAARFACLARKG